MKIGKFLLLGLVVLLTASWKKSDLSLTAPTVRHCNIRWYREGPHLLTANGEVFNPFAFTYASKTDKIGTVIWVQWKGKMVQVRCNDRGPNEVELTYFAFKQLEDPDTGVLKQAKVTKIK